MNALQEHMFRSYLNLRYGMAIIGAIYPVIVYAVGWLDGHALQDSISAYYWLTAHGDARPRVWMVGGLFAVAAFLYLYKGFTVRENVALNLAAVFAVGVAIFPTKQNCTSGCFFTTHGVCAVSMFVCLVYVVWFCARDTLHLLPRDDEADEPDALAKHYRRRYLIIGAVMLASPLTAFLLNSVIGTHSTYVFFIEAAGIWAFALYWWVKSSELKQSGSARKAMCGEIDLNPAGKPDAAPVMPAPPVHLR